MSSPSPSPSSAMLRLLGADSGSRFALVSSLSFGMLVPLVQTCRTWRRWLDAPGAMTKHQLAVSLDRAPGVAACPWILRHLSGLCLHPCRLRSSHGFNVHTALDHLVSFPQLRSLSIFLDVPCIDDPLWAQCATHLAPTLVNLSLLFSVNIALDATVAVVAKHLDKLTGLSSLVISGLSNAPEKVDISALPKLPRLQSFRFSTGAMSFLWSARQLPHLCACKQLVSLTGAGFGRHNLSIWEQRVIDFIDSRFPPGELPLPAITDLTLPALTPAVWSRLTRLSSLEALEPYTWIGFGAEEWSKLSMFTALRRVMLQPVSVGEVLDASLFAGPLSTCATIESLEFGRVRLSEHNLGLLMKGLLRLHFLKFSSSILETLAPLSFTAALTKLTFHHCKRSDDIQEPFEVRRQLPSLTKLTQLSICPVEGNSRDEQEALTAAVLARMPALRPENFEEII